MKLLYQIPLNTVVFSILQPEVDGQHHTDGHGVVAHFAHTPLGHLADDSEGLVVQALVARTTDDTHIAHLAVNANDETAQHTALDAFLVGMIGILTRLVDEVDEPTLAAGELRLNVHIVKVIDLHIGMLGHRIDSSDMAHLCCQGQHSG